MLRIAKKYSLLCALLFSVTLFAADRPKVVIVFGDSLAAGYGVEPNEAFPALLQEKVNALKWDVTIQNAGVSGDTSAGGLRRADWVFKKPFDVLVLELGGNDGLRGLSLSQTRTNLQTIIDKARKASPEVRIIIAGMQMPPNLGQDYISEFQKIYPDLARANRAALIPFLLQGVGGREDLNQPDRIHPTPEGHALVAENVWKTLKPILEQLLK